MGGATLWGIPSSSKRLNKSSKSNTHIETMNVWKLDLLWKNLLFKIPSKSDSLYLLMLIY